MLPFLKSIDPTSGLFGIDFQPDGIAIARVQQTARRRPRVSVCEFRAFGGDEHKALARLTADFRLKRTRCTAVLAERDYKLLLTEAPEVRAEELKAAVRWRIKDLIDFHINDATLDVFDIPATSGAGKVRAMYAVVARNEAIQRRVDALHEAGAHLEVIDIPEMALRNVAALMPEDASGVALLSLNEAGGLITVTKQGEIYFTRSIDLGLETLRTDARTPHFERIALEIQRSLDYFDSHFRLAPIAQVLVAPTTEPVPGLIEHLAANLNVRVAELNVESLFDWERPVSPAVQARCLKALGAALREERAVL